MEKQIKEAFGAVKMPRDCADGIQSVMEQKYQRRTARLARQNRALRLALCVVSVLLLASCGGATEKIVEEIVTGDPTISASRAQSRLDAEEVSWVETYREGTSRIYLYWHADGSFTAQTDILRGDKFLWLEEDGGRIWLTANGERIDITDEFTEEEPYLYTYLSENGLFFCCLAVAGTPGPEGDALSGLDWCEEFYYLPGETWIRGNMVGWLDIDWESGSGNAKYMVWYREAIRQMHAALAEFLAQ